MQGSSAGRGALPEWISVIAFIESFPGGAVVKNLSANAENTGQEDLLDEEIAIHSSTLA